MKFILLSLHSHGNEVPEAESAQFMQDLGAWVTLIKATVAMPIRGGRSVTAQGVSEYAGDLGGLLIFEADTLEQAIALTKKSPGLKYGFTHEVFPEIAMEDAARTKLSR